MYKKKIKKYLERYTIPPYDQERFIGLIIEAKKKGIHFEKLRMSSKMFFIDQLRFIQKRTWVLKLLIICLALAGMYFERLQAEHTAWRILAVSTPVLCLVNVNELSKICCPGMTELQMTCKNTLSKIFLTRIIVFGFADLLGILLLTVWGGAVCFGEIWQAFLYSIVPYQVMCTGCMVILNKCREESNLLYCAVWGCLLGGILFCFEVTGWGIFTVRTWHIWFWIGIIAVAGFLWQIRDLIKKIGGNQNEINFGTSV